MASDETVADIVSEMRDGVVARGWMEQVLREFADRIDAAHNREIAELRECLKDALTFVCSGCKDHTHKMCRFNRWRKALEGAKDGE